MTEAVFAESLGAWILRRRDELGLTQLQVALSVGVGQSTLARWENGSRMVSAYHHARLKACFKAYEEGAAK